MNEWNNCETCKYFYDIHYVDEFCEACAQGICHLCAKSVSNCNYYEKGEVPQNKKRGSYL